MSKFMEYKTERENSTWVALTRGTTYENNTALDHTTNMVRFDMPMNYTVAGRTLKNNKTDVAKFFNSFLYDEELLNDNNLDSRLINANDLPSPILEHIEYFSKFIAGTYSEASNLTYEKKRLFGH